MAISIPESKYQRFIVVVEGLDANEAFDQGIDRGLMEANSASYLSRLAYKEDYVLYKRANSEVKRLFASPARKAILIAEQAAIAYQLNQDERALALLSVDSEFPLCDMMRHFLDPDECAGAVQVGKERWVFFGTVNLT